MPTMTVHLLGIMYFHICHAQKCDPKTRQILIPDGSKGGINIPDHSASLFIEEARFGGVEGDWPGKVREHTVSIPNMKGEQVDVRLFEFRFTEPCTEVTFPDGGSDKVEVVNLDEGLPQLSTIAPWFQPYLNGAGSIARVLVGGGKFQVSSFNGINPVHWTMESGNQPFRIKAKSPSNKEGSLVVIPQNGPLGAEIAFMNSPDLLAQVGPRSHARRHAHTALPGGPSHGHDDGHPHFALYDLINKNKTDKPIHLPPHLMSFKCGHALFKALGDVTIQSSCTGTCCAK